MSAFKNVDNHADNEERKKSTRRKKSRIECVIRVSIFFFFLLVYVVLTRSRLSQVRDKKENDRCRKIQGVECKRVTRGKRGEKVWKKEDEVANLRTGRKRETGTPKLFEVIAVRSRFSPFTSPSFASFFFLFCCRFKHSFKQVRPPPCFCSSLCASTALYACK